MKVRTIKDVDEETWKTFKEMAGRRKLKMGRFLSTMVREHKRRESLKLPDIIPKKPIFTEKEAEEIKKYIHKIRHEYGFRK